MGKEVATDPCRCWRKPGALLDGPCVDVSKFPPAHEVDRSREGEAHERLCNLLSQLLGLNTVALKLEGRHPCAESGAQSTAFSLNWKQGQVHFPKTLLSEANPDASGFL